MTPNPTQLLRNAIAATIDARYSEARAIPPGEARKPIYAAIRGLKTVLRRADKIIRESRAEGGTVV